MKIIKNLSNYKMFFYEDSDCISLMEFSSNNFIWHFDGDRKKLNPMIVTKNHKVFYDNLCWLMEQSYIFSEESAKYNLKTENKLEFMSNQVINNDITPRLVIIRRDQAFELFYRVPREEIEDYGFPIKDRRIVFIPNHNGQVSDNVITGDSLEDDIIRIFNYTLEDKRIIDDIEFMEGYNNLKTRLNKKGKTLGNNLKL